LIEQIYLNHCKKVQIDETKRFWALNTVGTIIKSCIKKKNLSKENKLKYFLYFWKLQSMNKESQIDIKKRALIISASNETLLENEKMGSDEETVNWNLKMR